MKARKIKARPGLCAKGSTLRKQWAGNLNRLAHQMHGAYAPKLDDDWQKMWGKGYDKYARHVAGCLTCQRSRLAPSQIPET